MDLNSIDYFQEHINTIIENFECIKFSSDITSFQLVDTIVISSDVTIESEHQIEISCPDFSKEMFYIRSLNAYLIIINT